MYRIILFGTVVVLRKGDGNVLLAHDRYADDLG